MNDSETARGGGRSAVDTGRGEGAVTGAREREADTAVEPADGAGRSAERPSNGTGLRPEARPRPAEGTRRDPRWTTGTTSGRRPAGSASRTGTVTPEPAARGARRARLVLRRVDPWSVLKLSFLFSLSVLIVLVVAVTALYYVLDNMGVFDSINTTVQDFTDSAEEEGSGVESVLSASRIIGTAALLGAVNVVLITALATLGAFLYNLCADLVGGVEVTLSEGE